MAEDRQLLHFWRGLRRRGPAPRLLGDFAFAIWGHRPRNRTRPRPQTPWARPLYYTVQPGFFALASEDEALSWPRAAPSPASNIERIAYRAVPAFWSLTGACWFAQVRILMPGTALRIGANGAQRFWTWW